MHSQHRGVEQLVARRAHNPEVGGPSPPSATKQEVNPNGWPLIVFPPHVSFHHIQQPITHLFKHRNSETNIQAQLTGHLFAHKKPDFGKRLRDYVLTPIYEASTFAEKQLKMEELIPMQSASRYRKTIDDYKLRLKDNPDLKLSEFCKEVHTNYRRVLGWTRRHGISISALKHKASGGTAWGLSDTEPGNAFIQFVPSSRLTSASLLGISITFPDGVNLTLQESSVESVISLLTIYQSRHGGAKSCSD